MRVTVHRLLRVGLLVGATSFASIGLLARPLAAQTDEELSEARAAFQRGIELEQAENWAEALRMFRQVGQVKMTPQVRYHIALCEERLGRLVAALGGYELALADADAVQHASFKSEVEQSVQDLKARIPKLVIQRGEGAEAATIELDGVALGSASVGTEVPVDPGAHTVIAKAPGYEEFRETAEVREEETTTVEVVLVRVPEPEADTPPPSAPPAPGPGERFGVWPYVAAGTGAALLVGSGVMFFLRSGLLKDLTDSCTKTSDDQYDCTGVPDARRSELKSKDERVKLFSVLAPVSAGVGLAAVSAGVGLYFLDRGGPSSGMTAGWHVSPSVPGGDLGGVSLTARF